MQHAFVGEALNAVELQQSELLAEWSCAEPC